MRASALLLILLTAGAWGRDPFSSVQGEHCSTGTKPLPGLTLQGIIGRTGHYEAWLVLAAGKRQRVRVNDRLAGTEWQVTYIDLQRVSLADASACHSQLHLVLKGMHNAKENRADSADNSFAEQRRSGSALSGF